MGAGGDGRPNKDARVRKDARKAPPNRLSKLSSVKDDLLVLKSIWFTRSKGDDHAARLEHFYGPQAAAYDKFRTNFLWGRKPMLAACASRLQGRSDMVWVDLGGGTAENVDMMSQYMNLDCFKAIYVVDLCHSLCEVAKAKVKAKGWKNVHIVESDACRFQPLEGSADLITFSYSLSMIPPHVDVIDKAVSYLHPEGLMGVADFYVSSRYDLPMRQMSWVRRFFWRATFDTDNIDLGPERRAYLETKLERAWERNSEGSIPYVPYLRAPYYIWLGRHPQFDHAEVEIKVEPPVLFPPTFLYTQSSGWCLLARVLC
jgi:betaine lipid synthase